MKYLIIICEGPTEIEFCKKVLYPHLFLKGITLQPVLPKKSGGGIVGWDAFKTQIKTHLSVSCSVSTFIDFYGLKSSFPNYKKALGLPSHKAAVELIEKGMADEVYDFHFIPYIQLHEFEGLLFSDIAPFRNSFSAKECNLAQLLLIMEANPNPELINNGKYTAPSKRLLECIPVYNKVIHGSEIAVNLGLESIMLKCPRFRRWIETLESI